MSVADNIRGYNQVEFGCNQFVCPRFFGVRFIEGSQEYYALQEAINKNGCVPLHVSHSGEHRLSFYPTDTRGIEVGCSALAAKGFPWQLDTCPSKVGDIKNSLLLCDIDLDFIRE